MTLYLNVVYFGNGAYGAEAAAQSYFGKSAADLTCAEAAQLAGIVKAPSTYAPHINMEKSVERRNLILRLMREQGFIDETLYQSALQEEPELKLSRPGQYDYGYYIDAAINEAMEKLGMSYEELVSSGYRIYTGLGALAAAKRARRRLPMTASFPPTLPTAPRYRARWYFFLRIPA